MPSWEAIQSVCFLVLSGSILVSVAVLHRIVRALLAALTALSTPTHVSVTLNSEPMNAPNFNQLARLLLRDLKKGAA